MNSVYTRLTTTTIIITIIIIFPVSKHHAMMVVYKGMKIKRNTVDRSRTLISLDIWTAESHSLNHVSFLTMDQHF
jgi:hypothetical protein